MRQIVQGEQEVFNINLTQTTKQLDGTIVTTPYDLTGNTEIEVCFKVDPILVSKKKTSAKVTVIGADIDGKIQTTLEIADSDSFAEGTGIIEVVETKGVGIVTKFQIIDAFQIVKKVCV